MKNFEAYLEEFNEDDMYITGQKDFFKVSLLKLHRSKKSLLKFLKEKEQERNYYNQAMAIWKIDSDGKFVPIKRERSNKLLKDPTMKEIFPSLF